MVNPNYKWINAKDQTAREDSVFSYYKELIRLRKTHEIIVYGSYDLLLPDDPDLYVYTRTLGTEKLLVICNFSENTRDFVLPEWCSQPENTIKLTGNYSDAAIDSSMQIRPYEAVALLCKL